MTIKRLLQYSFMLLLMILLASSEGFGQRIRGTVIAGGNLSQVEGDELKGWSQAGLVGGVGAIIPFGKNNNWGVNLETLFNQKGSFQKKRFESDSLTDEYRLRLNYFEVPVYVSYTDKDMLSFGLGGYWGRLVSAREQEHSGKQEPYIDTVAFDNNDWGFLVDVRVRIWKPLHIGVRYSQSLVPIRERYFPPRYGQEGFTRKQTNQVISLRLVYIFNEGRREVIPQ